MTAIAKRIKETPMAPYMGLLDAMTCEQKMIVDGANQQTEYGYNNAGDLLYDANKGIASIKYDHLGHPIRVQFTNGNLIEYVYAADGRKLREKHTTAVGGLTMNLGDTLTLTPATTLAVDSMDYADNLRIRNQQFNQVGIRPKVDYYYAGGFISLTPSAVGYPISVIYDMSFHSFLRDHQGNVRVVADGSDNIKQINHYYPYGGPWYYFSTDQGFQPFKYNGKELDRVHGLDWYDYGARRYDPAYCMFTQMDPLAEQYPYLNPYVYCAGNPVRYVDPDGKKVVFVNGYLGFGSPEGGAKYWHGKNSSFVNMAKSTFKDYASPFFVNYNYKYLESASLVRESLGYQYAKENYQSLISGMKVGEDKFNFVSHSMGGAFSEGMMKFLNEQGWDTENALFLNTWEPKQIKNKTEKTRIDATSTNDPVQFLSEPLFGTPDIPLSDYKIRTKSDKSILYRHRDLIDGNSKYLWNLVKNLLEE